MRESLALEFSAVTSWDLLGCGPRLPVSPTESGEARWRVGSDESGTSFVVPLTRSLPRVSPFGLLLRRSLSRPPGVRVSKTLRVTVPSQQPHQALPQAKPLDCIGVPDLGETVR